MADTKKAGAPQKSKSAATQKGGKKTSPPAKSTSKKPSPSGKSPKSVEKNADSKRKLNESSKQKFAIILAAVAVLLLMITVFKGENVWLSVHNFFFRLFGITAYVWPVMLIYIAVTISKNYSLLSEKGNLIGVSSFAAILSGLIHVFSKHDVSSLKEQIITAWNLNNGNPVHGGIIGAVIGGIPLLWFGKTAARVFLLVVLIAVFMLLTGTTLWGIGLFFKDLGNKAGKIKTEIKDKRSEDFESFDSGEDESIPRTGFSPVSKIRSLFVAEVPEREDAGTEDSSTMIIDELVGHEVKRDKKDNYKLPKPFIDPNTGEVVSNPLADIDKLIRGNTPRKTEINDSKSNDSSHKVKKINLDSDTVETSSEKKTEVKDKKSEKTDSGLTLFPVDKKAESSDTKNDRKEKSVPFKVYVKPGPDCLQYAAAINSSEYESELKEKAKKLVDTLNSFGVSTKIVGISRGPSVTRYELQPAAGVKISKITSLADDIALALASSGVRIEAPIPNKSAVGIEVPNKNRATVSLKEIVETPVFISAKSKLNVALGKDITGNTICADIDKMPHLLIAGTTGSGKSVCLNSMIVSILFNATPDEVKLVMIDPKQVEFKVYNGIPHLLVPVVSDPRKAAGALGWAVTEMLQRYKMFSDYGVRDIKGFNKLCQNNPELTPLPRIAIFIDELSDLMMVAPNEVEDSICRLAQMARAAGMHLIIATQRPSVNVITGIIKANIPSRIALSVSSQIDSRTILDTAGAEKLLGNGDMLFCPVGLSKPVRIQGCYLSDEEVEKVVSFIKKQADEEVTYDESVIQEIEKQATMEPKKGASSNGPADDEPNEYGDEMVPKAIEVVVEAQMASTTLLQRKLKLGYARAARIIDELEQLKVIGPFEGSKPRKVLYTKEQWYEMNALRSMPAENPIVTDDDTDGFDDEE